MIRVERIPGALFGAAVVIGLLMTFGWVDPPGSLDKSYPWWVDNVWAAWLTVSSATVLGAMLWQKYAARRSSPLVPTAAYVVEMVGLIVLMFTFLIHVAAVYRVDDDDPINYLSAIHFGLAVGCALQAWDNFRFLRRAERPGARGTP